VTLEEGLSTQVVTALSKGEAYLFSDWPNSTMPTFGVYSVVVQLQRDPATFSGYHWSSGDGPPIHLSAGTLARAEVTTRERPPIDLVVPIMKRLSGIGG
jgi:hypothetical protein